MRPLSSVMADIERRVRARQDATVEDLRQRAELIAADAKSRVLQNRHTDRPRPSTLANSIAAVEKADGALVQATAPYARFVEFGTARRPAEPFLGPGFAVHTADIISSGNLKGQT